jgi:hypothetical protein
MNTRKLRTLFTLLGLATMLLPYPLSVIGMQSRSASINLIGTEWQGAPITYAVGSALGTFQCSFIFKGEGQAIYKCLAIQSPGVIAGSNLNDPTFVPGIDNPYRPKLVMTPLTSASGESRAKYTQSGNSIRIEFSDARMNVTIKDNILFGETTYSDTSKGKEKWIMQKLSNSSSSGKSTEISSNKSTASKRSKILSKQIIDKYNPIKFTSNLISGELLTGGSEKYYYFMVAPGDLTVTLSVSADARSSFSSVQAVLFDPNEASIFGGERQIGSLMTMTNYGRTTQQIQKIRFSENMPVLIHIKASNLGGGKYSIRLDGALDVEQSGSSSTRINKDPDVCIDCAISASQQLIREMSDRRILEDQAKERVALEHLSSLGTYKASTEIIHKDTEIIGTLVIKVISVRNGQIIVEVKGENGITLNGILSKAGFSENELVLRGIVAVDFGRGLRMQNLDFILGFTVEDKALSKGRFYLGTQPDNVVANGKFIKAEPVSSK